MTLPADSICLDVQGAQDREHFDRGIPRYVAEQARAVWEQDRRAVHSVALNPAMPLTQNLDWLLGHDALRWTPHRGSAPDRLPRIYHVMSPIEMRRPLRQVWPVWARHRDVLSVATVYDLIPYVFQDHYLREPAARARYLARMDLLRSLDHLLAISQSTKADLVEHLGVAEDRVTVVDAGVSTTVQGGDLDLDRALQLVHERFPQVRPDPLLYVGGIDFRKNNERLIEAYGLLPDELRRRHQLIILCRMLPDERAALRAVGDAAGIPEEQLILTGYVSDGELSAFYRVCRLFVFASFYEGSGLPILEAMSAGAPVIASSTSTSPEILGDLEGTFDPMDPADIARCIAATVDDEETLARLRERSARRVAAYSWQHVGERTTVAYERTLARARSGRRRARRRARLAVYTPWPPDRSGIAAYNRELLPELAEHADIDVVVAGDAVYEEPEHERMRLLDAQSMAGVEPLRPHDTVLYCMGNSHFHGFVYEALRRRTGVVVAHDVRLSGFYGWYAGRERPEDPGGRLAERVRAMYPERLGSDAFAAAPPTGEELAAHGLFMSQEIQEYASKILVHSAYARDLLRLDLPVYRPPTPDVEVVPLAQPAVRADRAGARAGDPQAPLLVSFGILSEVKHLAVLIEAFSLIAVERPGARLVLAGGGEQQEQGRWRAVAAAAGVGDRVEVTGHVDRVRYDELLDTATVALQLRRTSNGEASAAAADCISAGLPLIVTDLGWFAELPDDAALRVPQAVASPALAAAIERLVDAPELRTSMAQAGRRYAGERSFREVARRYALALGLTAAA